MTVTLCNKSGTGNTAAITNNNSGASGTVSAVAAPSRPSSSGGSAPSAGGAKWKVDVMPAGNAATLPRPKRDFRFQRIEVQQSPKWFVWPKRNKKSKSAGEEKTDSGSSSASSENNNGSRPPTSASGNAEASKNSQTAAATAPKIGANLEKSNNNNNNNNNNNPRQQQQEGMSSERKISRTVSAPTESDCTVVARVGYPPGRLLPDVLQRIATTASTEVTTVTTTTTTTTTTTNISSSTNTSSKAVSPPLNIVGARNHHHHHHHHHHLLLHHGLISSSSTRPINISCSEPNSTMRRRAASNVEKGHHISGSAPAASQTFKILSISKKIWESGDDDDYLDLENCVILPCRQPYSNPAVLSPPAAAKTAPTAEVKEAAH